MKSSAIETHAPGYVGAVPVLVLCDAGSVNQAPGVRGAKPPTCGRSTTRWSTKNPVYIVKEDNGCPGGHLPLGRDSPIMPVRLHLTGTRPHLSHGGDSLIIPVRLT